MDHDTRKLDLLTDEHLQEDGATVPFVTNEQIRNPAKQEPIFYEGKSPLPLKRKERSSKLRGTQENVESRGGNEGEKTGEGAKGNEARRIKAAADLPRIITLPDSTEEKKRVGCYPNSYSSLSEEKKANPLHPKIIECIPDLYRHSQCLHRAYELLSSIRNGDYLGEHVAHVTEREVLSLRASLEGTKSITQQWSLLLQHHRMEEENADEEFERGDPLYRPSTPVPPLGGVGCSSDSSLPFSSSSFAYSSPFHDRLFDVESPLMIVEQERLEVVFTGEDDEDNNQTRGASIHLRHPTQNGLSSTARGENRKFHQYAASFSSGSGREHRRRENDRTSSNSYGSSNSFTLTRRAMMVEIQTNIQQCEKLAEILEDHVESSCLAKMCDPVFDIDLPSLSTPTSLSTHTGAKRGFGNLLDSVYSTPDARKDSENKLPPSSSTVRHRHHASESGNPEKNEVLVENPVKQQSALPSLLVSLPPTSTPSPTPESQEVRSSPMGKVSPSPSVSRRQLGVAPSSPDVESPPWPPYWKIILHTPWERRLQLFTVGFFNFFVCCQLCVVVTMLLVLFGAWYIRWGTILYVVYIFTLGKPKFPVHYKPWYRSLIIWRYFRDYFPVRQIISEEVRQQFVSSKNYIFGYHPHAAHAFGALVTFGGDANGLTTLLPGIECHLQTLRINFFVPFWRELCCWMGFGDASSTAIRQTLQSGPGQSVVLAVGGAEESLFSRPRSNDLVLAKRKGFVKMALETGSALVPVYAFGETDTYEARSIADSPTFFQWAHRIKRITGFMIPMICGRGPLKLVPLRRPIYVVIGAPIDIPKIPNPSGEDIDLYHQKYIEALQSLYHEYCGVLDVGSEKLNIIQ